MGTVKDQYLLCTTGLILFVLIIPLFDPLRLLIQMISLVEVNFPGLI